MIEGGNRVNSIQIFWSLIFIYANTAKIKPGIRSALLLFYFICMISFSIYSFTLWQYGVSLLNNQTVSFISSAEKSNENTIIAAGILSFTIPYQAYFTKHGDFGKENIEVLPITFNYLSGPVSGDKQVKMIDCNYCDGDLVVRKIDSNASLSIDPYNLKYSAMIKNKVKSEVRGYDLIEMNLASEDGLKSKNVVYYDGIGWKGIYK